MSKHKNNYHGEHRAKKQFGQNFLNDSNIIDLIVKNIDPRLNEDIIEIGPGLGALSEQLVGKCNNLTLIELDWDIIPILQQNLQRQFDQEQLKNLEIISEDALKFNFSEVAIKHNQKIKIVGNLPYNISTPLLFHLISHIEHINEMYFMLQKEVVDRIAAGANEKNYGRLSVMIQYHCKAEKLFDVPPESFSPQPKVDSAILKLEPHSTIPYPCDDYAFFSSLVTQAFSQRRKTIRNCLKKICDESTLKAANIDPQARAENIAIENFVDLSNLLYQNKK